MESVETINSTLNTFLSVCQVLLCYVIPLILVIWTTLTFTKLFGKWEIAVYSAKDGFVKATEAEIKEFVKDKFIKLGFGRADSANLSNLYFKWDGNKLIIAWNI